MVEISGCLPNEDNPFAYTYASRYVLTSFTNCILAIAIALFSLDDLAQSQRARDLNVTNVVGKSYKSYEYFLSILTGYL